jgi:urease accessory protein UreE
MAVAAISERLAKLEQEQVVMREALARAEAERERARAERDEYRKLYLLLQEENEQLKRGGRVLASISVQCRV